MLGTFEIIDERWEEFNSKNGHQRVRRLALQDKDRPALLIGLDYEPKGEDVKRLPEGNATGKIIKLGIRNLRAQFGGRFAVDAQLMEVSGETANGAVKNPVGK